MALTTTLNKTSFANVTKAIEQLGFNVSKEIKVAMSATARQVKIQTARQLRQHLKAPVKVLKKTVMIGRPRNEGLTAVVVLFGGYKIPLKYFKPRQTKRKGVTATVAKGRRVILPNAFVVKRYDNAVFERKGPNRGPLAQQAGPAPAEVYVDAQIDQFAIKVATEQAPKQIKERLRFLTLKAQGKLKGKQKG